MRQLLFVIVFANSALSQATIFGSDDRREPEDIKSVAEIKKSVAMMQSVNFFSKNETTNTYTLDFPLASDSFSQIGLCKDEKFANQKAGYINCTGFLVAEDILVTAGHCMIYSHSPLPKIVMENETPPMCSTFDWMFGYEHQKTKAENTTAVPADSVYHCEKVIYAELFGYPLDNQGEILLPVDPVLGQDFAIIKLDRKVVGRKPIQFASQPVSLMEPLFTLGHPMGLPMKYTGGAKALNVSYANYIVADLDVIGGNSGGPVFNSNNEVTSLVVRSFPGEDFNYDEKQECSRPAVCPVLGQGSCKDENGHPVGSHLNRIEPVVTKLKELGFI